MLLSKSTKLFYFQSASVGTHNRLEKYFSILTWLRTSHHPSAKVIVSWEVSSTFDSGKLGCKSHLTLGPWKFTHPGNHRAEWGQNENSISHWSAALLSLGGYEKYIISCTTPGPFDQEPQIICMPIQVWSCWSIAVTLSFVRISELPGKLFKIQ